jgi:hypothetical protein
MLLLRKFVLLTKILVVAMMGIPKMPDSTHLLGAI